MSTIPGNFTDGTITAADDGGNSESLPCFNGDFSVTLPGNDGRSNDLVQAQGAYKGARKGERVPVTMTFTGIAHDPDIDFHKLVTGVIGGFTSVTADIGDSVAFDLTFDGSYGAETRTFVLSDCFLDSYVLAQGSPNSTMSFSVTCIGPVTINGTTYISSR